MEIFLDLDEVLVDFLGGACRAHGLTHLEMIRVYGDSVWTGEKFIRPIVGDADFWTGLKPFEWADELIALVQRYDSAFHIVTCPLETLTDAGHCQASYTGKVRWMKQFFGPRFDRFLITPHKYKVAKPGAVLIDDSPPNCNRFVADEKGRATGGKAVLFPHRRNDNRHAMTDPVAYVRESLRSLTSSPA